MGKSDVAARFEATFRSPERGRVIERLDCALTERKSDVAAAAKTVESDPAFAEAAAISEWNDAEAVDRPSRR